MTRPQYRVRLLDWVLGFFERQAEEPRRSKQHRQRSVMADDFDTLSRQSRQVVEEIEALARFSAGWDSYGAEPIGGRARTRAEELIELLRADTFVPRPRIVPTSDGGVRLSWSLPTAVSRLEIDATLFDSGDELTVGYADSPGYLFEGSLGDLRLLADRIRRFIDPDFAKTGVE